MTAAVAPLLVLAVGNPSRGDDALGPMLAQRLDDAGLPGVEILIEYQLQIEHALDLQERELVIFVDAGTGATPAPFELREPAACAEFLHTTHALSPEAVLATYERVVGPRPPRALVLCVRGESFELGEPLSAAARQHLEQAWLRLRQLCDTRSPEQVSAQVFR